MQSDIYTCPFCGKHWRFTSVGEFRYVNYNCEFDYNNEFETTKSVFKHCGDNMKKYCEDWISHHRKETLDKIEAIVTNSFEDEDISHTTELLLRYGQIVGIISQYVSEKNNKEMGI